MAYSRKKVNNTTDKFSNYAKKRTQWLTSQRDKETDLFSDFHFIKRVDPSQPCQCCGGRKPEPIYIHKFVPAPPVIPEKLECDCQHVKNIRPNFIIVDPCPRPEPEEILVQESPRTSVETIPARGQGQRSRQNERNRKKKKRVAAAKLR